jgi:hypothetical protein
MIHHIVMLKLKEFAEGKTKEENVKIFKQKLEDFSKDVEYVKEFRVGINTPSPYSNYDVVLHSYFETFDDLLKYQEHPEHKQIGEWVKKIREERCAIDYEF